MSLQYLLDNTGNTVAVQIPIDDWNILKSRYEEQLEVPTWHRDIIDQRMAYYAATPNNVTTLEDFIQEMEQDTDEEI
jgi:hypothetical protein